VLTIFFVTTPCGSAPIKGYEGPELPGDKVAIVEHDAYVDIESFDGQKPSGLSKGVALLPGFHAIEVSYRETPRIGEWSWSVMNAFVSLDAEAGHTYRIGWEVSSALHWRAYAVDKTTGKRIERPDVASATQAIERNPDNPFAYHSRAAAYALLGNYGSAMKDLDKVIELNPMSGMAFYDRGLAQSNLGHYELAIKDFDKSIELTPNLVHSAHVLMYYRRGIANSKLKNYPEAIKDFTKAIELNSRFAEAYYQRAIIYGETDNPERAVKDWSKAMEYHPDWAMPANSYSWMLATYKDPKYRNAKRAVWYGEKAVSIAERNNDDELTKSRCYDTLAAAYAESGDFAKAVETETKAYELYRPAVGTDRRKETYKALIEVYRNKKTYLQWDGSY
jgi:tetratricopeptide (TPR) repeat protein